MLFVVGIVSSGEPTFHPSDARNIHAVSHFQQSQCDKYAQKYDDLGAFDGDWFLKNNGVVYLSSRVDRFAFVFGAKPTHFSTFDRSLASVSFGVLGSTVQL